MAPVVVTGVKFTLSLERSILKPVSLFELSVHDRLIWLVETVVAVRLLGEARGPDVVALEVFE